MNISVSPADPGVTLHLAPVLDALAAADLKDALTPLVAAGSHVVLDGHDVERLATGPIQVMLAAEKSLAGTGRRLAMAEPSAAIRSAFDALGLGSHLDEWMSAHEEARADR